MTGTKYCLLIGRHLRCMVPSVLLKLTAYQRIACQTIKNIIKPWRQYLTHLCTCGLQARTSYLPSEILWAHRLFQLVAERRDRKGQITVDYRHLNDTIPIEMPCCSAKEYNERCGNISNDVITPDVARRVTYCPLQVHQHTEFGKRGAQTANSFITKL